MIKGVVVDRNICLNFKLSLSKPNSDAVLIEFELGGDLYLIG